MGIIELQSLARALGGEVSGARVICPGPGHSTKDRSLSVRQSAASIDGFVVHSFSGDDFRSCKDYVRARLGWRRNRRAPGVAIRTIESPTLQGVEQANVAFAKAIWNEAQDPRRTIVESYLASRALSLPCNVAGEVLRFHPRCPWKDERGIKMRVPAMVAAMRSMATEEITGIHRTRLTAEGHKIDRRMLGKICGAAIMLCPFTAIAGGLVVGEGIETSLAAWQIGWSNVWALGSVGAIQTFPVLGGVRTLVLLAENDENGASARAIEIVGERYCAAGREVLVVEPRAGGDLNDVVMGAA